VTSQNISVIEVILLQLCKKADNLLWKNLGAFAHRLWGTVPQSSINITVNNVRMVVQAAKALAD